MKSILTIATAALIAAPAFAAQHEMESNEQMTMMQQRLEQAFANCDQQLDEETMMGMTLAQVNGIIQASDSNDASDVCQQIEAIANN